jgi:hypothetical protein
MMFWLGEVLFAWKGSILPSIPVISNGHFAIDFLEGCLCRYSQYLTYEFCTVHYSTLHYVCQFRILHTTQMIK